MLESNPNSYIESSLNNGSSDSSNIKKWELSEIAEIYNLNFSDLIFQAQTILRKHFNPHEIQTSNLLSIKTGSCPEDCKYCPQSAHYNTGLKKESFMDIKEILKSAQEAKEIGASRFCMGAAWRDLSDRDIDKLCEAIQEIKALNLETCLTVGMIDEAQANTLAKAGLDYYNHNIDSSENYYKQIITTRAYQDRLETLKNITKSGMKTCCGGIVGMGETELDRLQMIETLSNLQPHPQSVPINMFVRVKGTPLYDVDSISHIDFIRTIATCRITMPKSYVRLSAGRNEMTLEQQSLCFLAGANSIFIGNKLLTTDNPEKTDDHTMLSQLGYVTKPL